VEMTDPQLSTTWNVIGKIAGRDPLSHTGAVGIAAHLDHIGVGTGTGDQIYNGADDNASGVTMVLEIMRALAHAPRPKRTIVFAFFGSEERGGLGAAFFRANPPTSSRNISTILNFDMVSRPVLAGPGKLVLTGSERSTLASELMKHSSALAGDTESTRAFFERSDSYILTRNGTVAHTLISSGQHADYHKSSDEITKVDFAHMESAIVGLLPALQWLLNNEFRPMWVRGYATDLSLRFDPAYEKIKVAAHWDDVLIHVKTNSTGGRGSYPPPGCQRRRLIHVLGRFFHGSLEIEHGHCTIFDTI